MSGPRYAELFAGAGGLSLGLERAGWSCAWHAEWADDPRDVLSARWPSVPLYGDVTNLDGAALTVTHGAIDLLSGGSPCQDLSVAGKRAGLGGSRSSLFYHQMRLWDETGADLCLWENVDGARSSNTGKDFGEVLRAFVGATIAVPSDGWRSAGVAAGPGGVAAWRVLDAQFFGVPQRRRRVFVLGTRTGRVDPAEVLSLAESVRGDSPTRREAREGSAADAGASVAFALRGREDGAQVEISGSVTSALRGAGGGSSRDMVFDALNNTTDAIAHTLRSNMDRASGYGGVLSFDWQKGNDKNNVRPSTMNVVEDATNTLGATRVPAVLAFGWQNSPAQGDSVSDSVSPSLDKSKTPAVVAFDSMNQTVSDVAHTLRDPHGTFGDALPVVCLTGDITHALTHEGHDASEDGTGRGTPIVALNNDSRAAVTGIAPPLRAGNRAQGAVMAGIPRRLTPRECERLMSWPDDHTLVSKSNGKPMSDSARYKMAGNGVASVVSQWIGWRLSLALGGHS